MSAESTPVSTELFDYIRRHTRGDDGFLQQLKQAAEEQGIPAIHIATEQASLMQILLQSAGASEVIEVGTLAGYSAIIMARALPQHGRLRTIELDPRHVAFATEWIARSDVAGRVHVLEGDGESVLAGFADESADAAFLDADKSNYVTYLSHSMRIVRPGGLILVDNAFAFGQLLDRQPTDPEVGAIREFNQHMTTVQGLQSVMVPVGDGLWVGVKSA